MSSNTKPLFVLGLPTNGEHSFLFTQFLLGTEWPTNFTMNFRAVPGYEVGDARNILVQEAINLKAKYLVFIDEDVIGPGYGVRRLLFQLETHPEWTVCGGVYATKTIPPEPLIFKEWGMGPAWDWKMGELIRVKSSGAGFHMYRVADLDKMKSPEPYALRNPWTGDTMKVRQWFKTSKEYRVDNGLVALEGHTEDSYFYHQCEQEGLQVWIDTAIACKHYSKETGMFYEVPLESGVAVKPDPWHQTPRRVNLGAGRAWDAYAINVDLRDDPFINFRCDIRKLPDDWGDQFDEAIASHVLEHFSYNSTLDILKEWLRILKPGGLLKVEVPDVQWACDQLMKGYEDPFVLGSIYGDQGCAFWNEPPYGGYNEEGKFLPHSFDHNAHKAGFTAHSLGKLFQQAGFEKVEGARQSRLLFMQGRKPEAPQQEENLSGWLEETPSPEVVADLTDNTYEAFFKSLKQEKE